MFRLYSYLGRSLNFPSSARISSVPEFENGHNYLKQVSLIPLNEPVAKIQRMQDFANGAISALATLYNSFRLMTRTTVQRIELNAIRKLIAWLKFLSQLELIMIFVFLISCGS